MSIPCIIGHHAFCGLAVLLGGNSFVIESAEVMPNIRILDPRDVLCGESSQVLAYWERNKGEALAPAWRRDFRLEDLASEIIPNMMVVDVIDGGRDYRYRFWGSNNTLHKGYEMSGKLLSASPTKTAVMQGMKQFAEVIRQKKPMAIIYELSFKDYQPGDQITFRFPLSGDGITIDKIVTYQDLSHKPENWRDLFNEFSKLNA